MTKEQIESTLRKIYPHATKELIAKMTEIYLYVSEENRKIKNTSGAVTTGNMEVQ